MEPRTDPPLEPVTASAAAASRWHWGILWVSVAIVAVDQATKALIRVTLPVHASRTVIQGFLDLTHVQNTGAAFGFLNAVEFPFKPLVLALVAGAALAAIAAYASRLPAEQRVARIGLVLILGGAAGNLIDRLTAGYVLDFVDAYFRGWHFWAFNVADSAITAGVSLLILDMLGVGSRAPKTP
jgi:signal peptidase II